MDNMKVGKTKVADLKKWATHCAPRSKETLATLSVAVRSCIADDHLPTLEVIAFVDGVKRQGRLESDKIVRSQNCFTYSIHFVSCLSEVAIICWSHRLGDLAGEI